MVNLSDVPTYTAYSALAMIDDLFGVRIKESTFDEWAVLAVQKIGLNLKTAKATDVVDEKGLITLPFNIFSIQAITTNSSHFHTWSTELTDPRVKSTDYSGSTIYDYSLNDSYTTGAYIDYEVIDRKTIKVVPEARGNTVYVLYTSIVTNSAGEWLFNDKQIEAIAYYCAFLYTQRNAFKKIPGIDLMYIKTEAARKTLASKIPVQVTQNQWDKLMDTKTSFYRKSYNDDMQF